MISKFFNLIKSWQYNLFIASCIGLIAFISYNLGRIDALEKTPIRVIENNNSKLIGGGSAADIYSATKTVLDEQKLTAVKLDTRVVVSKASSSKKYHYTWCASASKIKEENKIWFNSDKEAEASGYTLAGNCSR